MITEETVCYYRMELECDAAPPAGLHCDGIAEIRVPMQLTGSTIREDYARNEANLKALEIGWSLVTSLRHKYPNGRHLCPTCTKRYPKVKWAKR